MEWMPKWVREFVDKQAARRSALYLLVTDISVSADGTLCCDDLWERDAHWAQLLALRGQLAFGTFFHCLEKRARVEYGVATTAGAKKRLAIPFRATNTPALRSEWKHPDVAVTLTFLSYYYDGLSKVEMRQALTFLLSMGPSAQVHHYTVWMKVGFPNGLDCVSEADTFDRVAKIDLSNEVQMDVIHKHLSNNFEVVNFWLTYVVLPTETGQFPKCLGTNSWFLTTAKTTTG
ncbi:unnamed protein product, partial [Choristocarpus tenellus]